MNLWDCEIMGLDSISAEERADCIERYIPHPPLVSMGRKGESDPLEPFVFSYERPERFGLEIFGGLYLDRNDFGSLLDEKIYVSMAASSLDARSFASGASPVPERNSEKESGRSVISPTSFNKGDGVKKRLLGKSEDSARPEAVDKCPPGEHDDSVRFSFCRLVAHEQTLGESTFVGDCAKALEVVLASIARRLDLDGYL